MILGIDEAGRGPWAGPLVVGAVVLDGVAIEGLTDSKKLTKKKRELLYDQIVNEAAAYASGWVSANELDSLGMSQALRLATRRAVEQISASYTEIIIDGTINFLDGTGKGKYVKTMPKADLLIPSVSAASIIAKVERDRYMAGLDGAYPGYGFKAHAGYGVARHREAIERLGVTSEHRLSFAPLVRYSLTTAHQQNGFAQGLTKAPVPGQAMTGDISLLEQRSTKFIGSQAENVAGKFLERHGHTILERNWRTKLCEIDIVSQKKDTVHFIEVKYRKNDKAGDGLAMITPKKLKQMQFSAKLYAHVHRLRETDLKLAAIATTGVPPEVTDYIEIV